MRTLVRHKIKIRAHDSDRRWRQRAVRRYLGYWALSCTIVDYTGCRSRVSPEEMMKGGETHLRGVGKLPYAKEYLPPRPRDALRTLLVALGKACVVLGHRCRLHDLFRQRVLCPTSALSHAHLRQKQNTAYLVCILALKQGSRGASRLRRELGVVRECLEKGAELEVRAERVNRPLRRYTV